MSRRVMFLLLSSLIAMAMERPCIAAGDEQQETATIIVLFTSLLSVGVILWIIVRVFGRAAKLQNRALEQIERSDEHMKRAEQHMEQQEQQMVKIAQLLESIDSTLKKR